MKTLNLGISYKAGIWQRFMANWRKRNWLTDILLYGIQAAAVLYVFVMLTEITNMVCDFRTPNLHVMYKGMTIGDLFYRMFYKGWMLGLITCIIVFLCNRRVLRWNADGILWMFNILFVVSVTTLAVEHEMFLYFSIFSIISLAFYSLSLFLAKRIGETNTSTFQQCRKPSMRLITLSFIVLLLWSVLLCDTICRICL